ncbi:MAG: MoxR family ATPase [Gammaproteobacteria bacterium]|jgi:MoxR-like ATPase
MSDNSDMSTEPGGSDINATHNATTNATNNATQGFSANRADIATAAAAAKRLEQQICKAMVGQTQVIREVLAAMFAGGHVLIEGVPGLGKTLLVRAMAKAVSAEFSRIQFTPDLMPGDVTGHAMFDMKMDQFKIRRGPVFCNFLLADEINRAPAKTQSALLEVMQEQQVTIEGRTLGLQPPFMVLATQNPVEQEGTYPLPEAQVDRFLLKIRIDYPEHHEETDLVKQVTNANIGDKLNVDQVTTVFSPKEIIQLQNTAATIPVDEQVLDYIVRLVRATREWNGIQMGSGPRGSIALVRVSRAHALIRGNAFVTPDDVKQVAKPVLRHRIRLSPDLEIEGINIDNALDQVLNEVKAPRL